MNIPTIAGVVGTAGERPGLIGTSNALMGIQRQRRHRR
jgi:hypothetical protein